MSVAAVEELELKLRVVAESPAAALEALLAELPPARSDRAQDNVYLVDADRRTSNAQTMIRVREEGPFGAAPDRARLTVKRRAQRPTDPAGVLRSEERECDLDVGAWLVAPTGETAQALGAAVLDEVLRELSVDSLTVQGRLANRRRAVPLGPDGAGLVAEVDLTTFPDGHVDAEVEVEGPDVEALAKARDFVEAAAARAGVRLEPSASPKYARYLERL